MYAECSTRTVYIECTFSYEIVIYLHYGLFHIKCMYILDETGHNVRKFKFHKNVQSIHYISGYFYIPKVRNVLYYSIKLRSSSFPCWNEAWRMPPTMAVGSELKAWVTVVTGSKNQVWFDLPAIRVFNEC